MCEKSEQICKHTPGDWEAWQSPDGVWTVRATYEDAQGRRTTAWPAVCNAGAQPNEVNARLIAAAPKVAQSARAVIKALKSFSEAPSNDLEDQRWHFEVLPALRALEGAVAKAEGRS